MKRRGKKEKERKRKYLVKYGLRKIQKNYWEYPKIK